MSLLVRVWPIVLALLGSTLLLDRDFARAQKPKAKAESAWVKVGSDGKLVYKSDGKGNRVPDFSNCGYRGGDFDLPRVDRPEVVVEPMKGDAAARIQAAIDRVSGMAPDADGFRGVVRLKAGEYRIKDKIAIQTSGVVLRGDGIDKTFLIDTGPGKFDSNERAVIVVGKDGKWRPTPSTKQSVANIYVPVGARIIPLAEKAAFQVGQRVLVQRPSTEPWIQAIGMDKFKPRPDGKPVEPWKPGSKDLFFDRIVAAVDGDRIVLDAPITNALEPNYGGGFVFAYTHVERIEKVGIEDLSGRSEYAGNTDENHAWHFIEFKSLENGWVRNVGSRHFASGTVRVLNWSKWLTIRDCYCRDAVSKIDGGRRYSFDLRGGQLILFQDCVARDGRHDFVTASTVEGPNVYFDCTAKEVHADIGPHQRWAVGTLYDNVETTGDINAYNRGNLGSGQGWAGANHVLWNCEANSMRCETPPTASTWVIGARADRKKGDATWDSFGQAVTPRSLYRAQLAERKKGN